MVAARSREGVSMTQQAQRPAAGSTEGYQQRYLWVDGEFRHWAEVTMPLTQATWTGLSAVFEGIRAYRSPAGRLHLFGVEPHLRRFADSIAFMRLESPWTAAALTGAILESVRRNGLDEDCYVQPVAAPVPPALGFYPPPELHAQARVYIPVGPRPSALLSDRAWHCNVTSWARIGDRSMPPRVKAVPNYQNSRIAHMESMLSGFDAPIFLNERGTVAEGPGACIAVVREGEVITPPVTSGILESVTRAFLLRMIPEVLGIPVVEREIDRTELYFCREAFFLGTGAEVTPIRAIDHYRIGDGEIGPITLGVQRTYHDVVRAIDARYADWRTPV
jgi:branched-chain amino acid aminotransferase